MDNPTINVGDIIEVTAERLAYGGDAVARHLRLAVFIPFAAPQDRLRVRIIERKKNYARAVIDQILKPSPARRAAPCQYFGECGGCQLQHLTYEAQLESKTGFVRDALQRIARIDWPHEIKIRHSAELGYRGRAQVKIDMKAGLVGFTRGASNALCDIASCPILVPELDEALGSLRGAVTNATVGEQTLPHRFQVDMAAGDSGVSFDPAPERLPGGELQRTVNAAVYHFGASTFFQANPSLLDELVGEAVGSESGDVAIDLYAGVGLFTIQLARRFQRVIGIEADRAATKFAEQNITANGLANVEFHNDDVAYWLERFVESKVLPPDLIVLDPPRTGAAEALSHIVGAQPSRIVYVSCDPSTLARDLRTLVASGYELTRLTAIDLFPQTYHVETIATLVKRATRALSTRGKVSTP